MQQEGPMDLPYLEIFSSGLCPLIVTRGKIFPSEGLLIPKPGSISGQGSYRGYLDADLEDHRLFLH